MCKITKSNFKYNVLLFCSISCSLLIASAGSHANEADDNTLAQSSTYDNIFFSQYFPQNALDMINHLPGFSFDKGRNDRGFGGNAGNVLIDGVRPTSKTGGLSEALSRIPADQVLRIEVLRGGTSAGEAAGQSLVANVIRAKGSTSGTWGVTSEGNIGSAPLPRFQASLTTQLGQWQTSFNTMVAGWPSNRNAVISNYDSDNDIISSEIEGYEESQKWAQLTGEGSKEFLGGKLSLNGYVYSHIWIRDSEQDIYIGYEQPLPNENRSLVQDNRSSTIELGADWGKTYQDWKLRLIGLGMFRDTIADNQFTLFDQEKSNFASHDIQDSKKSELLSRITLAKVNGAIFKSEFGFEIANNKLKSSLVQYNNGVQQTLQSNDNVDVEEIRGEVFANVAFDASEFLTLEGGITAEYSQIEVNSVNSKKQNFFYIKPRVSSIYQISNQTQLSVALEHNVGQLNFGDFATSNEAFDGITNTGNSDLMPDQTTELAATFDWSISERGSLKIKAFHQWRKDILEQVIIGESDNGNLAYGVGNAGSAKFWGIKTDINLPLDFLLSDSLLEISHSYQGSDFYDSITNENRNINNYVPNALEMHFRQDFIENKFAWGLDYIANTLQKSYRVNEVQTLEQAKRFGFFIESTQFFGVKTSLSIFNKSEQVRSRFFHQNNRNDILTGSQEAHREKKPSIVLKFSGTF